MFCSQCGHGVDASATACPACGKPTGVTPAAPAVTPPRSIPPPQFGVLPQFRVSYAGFWLRFLAWMVDEALLVGIGFVLLGRLVSLLRMGSAIDGSLNLEPMDNMNDWYAALGLAATVLFALFFIVVSWLYHALMESSAWQGTIGKRALGIVVTDLNGARVNFGRATGRFFSRLVSLMIPLGIGYLLAGFTAQKQALHDLMSSCLVLRRTR